MQYSWHSATHSHTETDIGHKMNLAEVMYCRMWNVKRLQRLCIAVNRTPSHSYGVSFTIWNRALLSAIWHKWTHPAITPARPSGTQFTYPGVMEDWVDRGDWLVVTCCSGLPAHRRFPIQVLTWQGTVVDHKSGALTTTLPSHSVCGVSCEM